MPLVYALEDAWARHNADAYGALHLRRHVHDVPRHPVLRPGRDRESHRALFARALRGTRIVNDIPRRPVLRPGHRGAHQQRRHLQGASDRRGWARSRPTRSSDGWIGAWRIAAFLQNTKRRPLLEELSFRLAPATRPVPARRSPPVARRGRSTGRRRVAGAYGDARWCRRRTGVRRTVMTVGRPCPPALPTSDARRVLSAWCDSVTPLAAYLLVLGGRASRSAPAEPVLVGAAPTRPSARCTFRSSSPRRHRLAGQRSRQVRARPRGRPGAPAAPEAPGSGALAVEWIESRPGRSVRRSSCRRTSCRSAWSPPDSCAGRCGCGWGWSPLRRRSAPRCGRRCSSCSLRRRCCHPQPADRAARATAASRARRLLSHVATTRTPAGGVRTRVRRSRTRSRRPRTRPTPRP